MSKVICEREDLVAIADAVRNKTGETGELTLGEIASNIEDISVSDSTSNDILRSLVDRTITEVNTSIVEAVGDFAFDHCNSLTTVNLPAATSIGDFAFDHCNSLTTVNLPAATSIGDFAFDHCNSLTTVNLPAATSIGDSAFNLCDSLTTVNFPAATSIGRYAFSDCDSLTIVNLPAATSIGDCAFYNCDSLTTVNFSAATGTTIHNGAFRNCFNLHTVYLESSRLCVLEDSGAFDHTQIYLGSGFIFVPASLVDSYKTATNWARFSERIFAIGTDVEEIPASFKIDGISYQCKVDMTWEEWVVSDYNVDGWYVIDDMYVCQAGTTDTVVANDNGYISIADTIYPNATYWVDPY